MNEEKNIIFIRDNFALTDDIKEVELLPLTEFSRLIFQEFLKQLKIPHLKVEVSKSHKLFIEYPTLLEQVNDDITLIVETKRSVNKVDLITYMLVCYVLKSEFDFLNVYMDNQHKFTFVFQPAVPFTNKPELEIPFILKQLIKSEKPKKIKELLERFVILLGDQFKDKLLIYLTFLESKYNYKLDRKNFINSLLNPLELNKLNKQILNLLNQ
ncbi:MAG TPA: hypothetical protein EYG85_03495 [Crocinitomix sp.]|nr:hypothetical protein [Crocinitomix sp.]